uniref:Uncharacterized protein n=1 Tax=viral metagenome TaxID=1070528 RepID=A0A6M3LUG7_9ZZZZ
MNKITIIAEAAPENKEAMREVCLRWADVLKEQTKLSSVDISVSVEVKDSE